MPDDVPPDTFESAASATDDDGTFKYYQIAVPQFTFNEVGDDQTHTQKEGSHAAGNSFIRLGCFPDVANPSTGPVGFPKSLDLANLVGKKDAILAAEKGEDVSAATYKGDPNYLLGFADDTRHRPEATPTWTQRQAETLQLLTKGGWWDHSDGNRISTTKGDKIEIIQGNYKMVVLGRQSDLSDPAKLAANGLIRDVSGGMMEENGPSPTHCIKTIEWTLEEGGTWSVYENNGIGNVYSSFYGDLGDIFFGQHKESWTGIAPDGFDTSEFYKNSMMQHDVAGYPALTKDPEIKEYTWAKKIESYTGSSGKKIPKIIEETWVETSKSTTHADHITDKTYADTIKSETHADSLIHETTRGGNIVEDTRATSLTQMTGVASAITALTTAPLISDIKLAAHILEVAVALKTSITASFSRSVYLGGRFELDLSVSHMIRIGPRFEMVSSAAETFVIGTDMELSENKLLIAATVLLGI